MGLLHHVFLLLQMLRHYMSRLSRRGSAEPEQLGSFGFSMKLRKTGCTGKETINYCAVLLLLLLMELLSRATHATWTRSTRSHRSTLRGLGNWEPFFIFRAAVCTFTCLLHAQLRSWQSGLAIGRRAHQGSTRTATHLCCDKTSSRGSPQRRRR